MKYLYVIIFVFSVLVYGEKLNSNIYKITNHHCLKHIKSRENVCPKIELYEFKKENNASRTIFIKWKNDGYNHSNLYYNANLVSMPKKREYPYTLILNDGSHNSYIETIQFLDKNHGIYRGGYMNGLVEEVYFETISEIELGKYKRNYPNPIKKNLQSMKKSHISKKYFKKIMKDYVNKDSKEFPYFSIKNNNLKKKIYGLDDYIHRVVEVPSK